MPTTCSQGTVFFYYKAFTLLCLPLSLPKYKWWKLTPLLYQVLNEQPLIFAFGWSSYISIYVSSVSIILRNCQAVFQSAYATDFNSLLPYHWCKQRVKEEYCRVTEYAGANGFILVLFHSRGGQQTGFILGSHDGALRNFRWRCLEVSWKKIANRESVSSRSFLKSNLLFQIEKQTNKQKTTISPDNTCFNSNM